MWLFGYGSLIFKQGFPFLEQRVCCVRGYRRLFWQGSTDHRGTPERPGRVVTLRPYESARCWGMAFHIEKAHEEQVRRQLDLREKNGYERLVLPLYGMNSDSPFADGECYVAASGNPHDLGCAPLPEIAAQIAAARGPSGSNRDYVHRLAEALRELQVDDAHVFRLEALVRAAE